MSVYYAVKARADGMNISIAELEKRAEVSNGTVGGWKNSKPYAETLRKIADVLGCTVNDLQDEAEAKMNK